jgi:hypothetical protein
MVKIFRNKIENYGEASIYQEMEHTPGVEFEVIIEKIKFIYDIGMKLSQKSFSLSDKDRAIDFLNNIYPSFN